MRRIFRYLVLPSTCLLAIISAFVLLPPRVGAEVTIFYADEPGNPSNAGGFEGPCGLAVDAAGQFYVSDYHRDRIAIFDSSFNFDGQVTKIDPADGPCGLAVDSSGNLYVIAFHRTVIKFTKVGFPFSFDSGVVIDSANPTGVAIDPETGEIYVNDRTYISVYEPSGQPVEVDGAPLRLGVGSLRDGYGAAFSTATGRVYVADAADDTVKVYDPHLDPSQPVAEIDASGTPAGRFISLSDAALAVDQATGTLYVSDDLQPEYFERPKAAIYAFDQLGGYAGRLQFDVVNARPPGLAVDNSATESQGRVYVTTGNTEDAAVYVYGPSPLAASVGAAAAGPAGLAPMGVEPQLGFSGSSDDSIQGFTPNAAVEPVAPKAHRKHRRVSRKHRPRRSHRNWGRRAAVKQRR